MESSIASALATITERLNNIEGDIAEMKSQYLTKEGGVNIKDCMERNTTDIAELKGNQSKVVWFIILAFLGAVLSVVLKN